jgi:DNA replication licensing factor MCM6
MAVKGQGLLGDNEEGTSVEAEKVVYVLHPNCAIEEM